MTGRSRSVRVLVADDEPVIRSALEALIAGHPELEFVGAAADAEEAIEKTATLRPDVVLLDVRMPYGGGPRAAAEIDALPDAPRTVAFSAYDDRSAIVSMLEAGACGYLVKGAPNADIVGTLLDASRLGGDAAPSPAPVAEPVVAEGTDDVVTVLVADEPGNTRESLIGLIEGSADLKLVAVAANGAEALRLACIHRPRTIMVGRSLPGDSTAAIQEIRQAVPDANILAFTADHEPRGVREAVEAGAMSFLVRGEEDGLILRALREAAAGRSTLSPAATDAVVRELSVTPARTRERRLRARRLAEVERFARGDGLEVALQPIYELASRRLVGVEALARFAGTSEGPSVWFAEAAEHGLLVDLELAAIRAALPVLSELPDHLRLSMNVSPQVVALPRFAEEVAGLASRRLVVELTEHAAVGDYALLADALRPLREQGLRVAVDDAGAGFASLRHVLLIEPDFLKLDISLCSGIAGDRRRRALARALIAFAQETGIRTLAEGIERAEDLEVLVELGVELGQGFHLARPEPAAELLSRL